MEYRLRLRMRVWVVDAMARADRDEGRMEMALF